MLTFKERVVAYIGDGALSDVSTISDERISEWLTNGATMLINMMPDDMLWQLSTTVNFTNTVSVGTNKIIGVTRETTDNYYPASGSGANDSKYELDCREIDSSLRGRAVQYGNFMEEASDLDPLFYKKDGVITILPSGNGKIEIVNYPTIDCSQIEIANYPKESDNLIVLYATQQCLNSMIKKLSERTTLSVGTLGEFTISAAAPTALSLSIDDVGDLSDTIGSFPDLPSFNPPVVSPDFNQIQTFLNDEDVELTAATVQGIQTELAKYQADLQVESAKFQSEATEYTAGVNKAMKQAEINTSSNAAEYQAQISKANALTQEHSALIQRFSAEVVKEVQEYSQEIAKLQTEIQEFSALIQERQLAIQSYFGVLKEIKEQYQLCLQAFLGLVNSQSLKAKEEQRGRQASN